MRLTVARGGRGPWSKGAQWGSGRSARTAYGAERRFNSLCIGALPRRWTDPDRLQPGGACHSPHCPRTPQLAPGRQRTRRAVGGDLLHVDRDLQAAGRRTLRVPDGRARPCRRPPDQPGPRAHAAQLDALGERRLRRDVERPSLEAEVPVTSRASRPASGPWGRSSSYRTGVVLLGRTGYRLRPPRGGPLWPNSRWSS